MVGSGRGLGALVRNGVWVVQRPNTNHNLSPPVLREPLRSRVLHPVLPKGEREAYAKALEENWDERLYLLGSMRSSRKSNRKIGVPATLSF